MCFFFFYMSPFDSGSRVFVSDNDVFMTFAGVFISQRYCDVPLFYFLFFISKPCEMPL